MKGISKLKVIPVALFMFGALVTATIGVIYTDETSTEGTPTPETGDSISPAEREDLQAVATQLGISLQEAIDRYAWNDDFASHVAEISQVAPESFAGAEIVDAGNAWIAFAGSAPQSALNLIDAFSDNHDGVSIEVRTDKGFTEVELQKAIKAAHFAVLEKLEVDDASTGIDFATGEISMNGGEIMDHEGGSTA